MTCTYEIWNLTITFDARDESHIHDVHVYFFEHLDLQITNYIFNKLSVLSEGYGMKILITPVINCSLCQIFCSWKRWFVGQPLGYLRDAMCADVYKTWVSFSPGFPLFDTFPSKQSFKFRLGLSASLNSEWPVVTSGRWPVRTISFNHTGEYIASASEDLFIDIVWFLWNILDPVSLFLFFCEMSSLTWDIVLGWNSQMFKQAERSTRFHAGLPWTVWNGILNTICLHMLGTTRTSIKLMKVNYFGCFTWYDAYSNFSQNKSFKIFAGVFRIFGFESAWNNWVLLKLHLALVRKVCALLIKWYSRTL